MLSDRLFTISEESNRAKGGLGPFVIEVLKKKGKKPVSIQWHEALSGYDKAMLNLSVDGMQEALETSIESF